MHIKQNDGLIRPTSIKAGGLAMENTYFFSCNSIWLRNFFICVKGVIKAHWQIRFESRSGSTVSLSGSIKCANFTRYLQANDDKVYILNSHLHLNRVEENCLQHPSLGYTTESGRCWTRGITIHVPRYQRSTLGRRAFLVTEHTVWKSLSVELKRSRLQGRSVSDKTCFFGQC